MNGLQQLKPKQLSSPQPGLLFGNTMRYMWGAGAFRRPLQNQIRNSE